MRKSTGRSTLRTSRNNPYMSKSSFKTGDLNEQKLALLARLLEEEGLPQTPSIQRIPRDGELPLSFAQMGLWLDDRIAPNSAAYNTAASYGIKGSLDLVALEWAFSEIVRRHEVLRTSCPSVDGRPVQKIAPPEPYRIALVDLQGLPEVEREEELARRASAMTRQPFDLATGPLLRTELLRLGQDEYLLWLVVHHIAFDWWSFGVLEKEWAVFYTAFLRGEPSPLPEPAIQYVDFAAWQRECLQGEVLRTRSNYWKAKLGGTLPFLDLPTDAPRPAVRTSSGARVTLVLPVQIKEALKGLSQREGVTLFVTLMGAFNVLLLRYTGQEDLLVGVPMATRHRPETQEMVGFFVNTVAMRTDASGDPTFRELLRRVQKTVTGAFEHQDLPFEKLVELVNPVRDASRSPIFQVAMSMLNIPIQPVGVPGLEIIRTEQSNGTSKFDIVLYVAEQPAGLTLVCEYNTDLFIGERMERMIGHLEVLLEDIVIHPEHRVSQLSLLPETEKHRLLVEWNRTEEAYPRGKSIHDLFAEQVNRRAESVALTGLSLTQASRSAVSWTYAELNRRANELAHYLQTLGVARETLVAVCLERTAEMAVALLGVMKAGGAYVPLDPGYPAERLAFILEDTQAPVVLTQCSVAANLPSRSGRVVCLDDPNLRVEMGQLASDEPARAEALGDAGRLAYVLYTSGSTGKPKGVAISHGAVVNFLSSMREVPGMKPNDTLLSVTTLSFDIFGLELWLPLTTGAKVVIAPEEVTRDGRELAGLMRGNNATVMQATPSTWRLLLESGWEGNTGLKILCGGRRGRRNWRRSCCRSASRSGTCMGQRKRRSGRQ